jgi:hypothetical protein
MITVQRNSCITNWLWSQTFRESCNVNRIVLYVMWVMVALLRSADSAIFAPCTHTLWKVDSGSEKGEGEGTGNPLTDIRET